MIIQNQIIKGVKIIHNGYKIKYVQTLEEVEVYIQSVLENYRHLNPKKICDKVIGKNDKRREYTKLVRYVYNTIYEEDFIIEVRY